MSTYIKYQYKKMLLLSVIFFIASISSVLVQNPLELLGIKGVGLLALTISSVVLVAKYESFILLFRIAYTCLFEKKEYSKNQILKFYGIKRLEIDDDTIFAKTIDGKNVSYAIVRILPFPFSFQHLPDEKREKYKQGWLNVLRGIDFKCFIRITSRKFNIQRYREAINRKISATPDPQVKERLNKLLLRVEEKARESVEKRFYVIITCLGKRQDAIKELKAKVDNLLSLIHVNLELEGGRLNSEEILEGFGTYFNPNLQEVENLEKELVSTNPTKDENTIEVGESKFLSVEKLRVERGKFTTYFNNEKTVNMFFNVKRFPSTLPFDWLPRLLDTIDLSYDLEIEITPLDVNRTIQALDAEIRNKAIDVKAISLSGSVPPQSMVENLEADKRIMKAFVLGEEKPYNVSIYGRAYWTSSDEGMAYNSAKKLVNALTSAINGQGFTAYKASFDSLREMARKTFFIPTLLRDDERLTLSSYLANIFPFGCSTFFSSDINPEGIFLGWVQPSLAPFLIAPHRLMNQLIVILGTSGSGKTTLAEAIGTRSHDIDNEVGFLFLDMQGEYVRYVQDRKGIVLSFGYETESEGVHTSINLLGLFGFPLPERKRQLLSLFSTVFPDLSFQAIGFLRQALDQAYSEKGMINDDPLTWNLEPPVMTDLVEIIRKNFENADQIEKSIFGGLERRLGEFAKSGGYAFFDGKTTLNQEDLAEKLVCINLKPLHSKYAKSLVAHTILQLVLGSFGVVRGFRYLVVDEGWFLLENASEENLLVEIAKTGRKFHTGLVFISQNLGDIQGKARAILNNAAVKILFKIDETEIDEAAKCFKLTPQLADQATRLKVGEALIKTPNIPTWIRIAVQKEEIETKPSINELSQPTVENKPVKHLSADYGSDPIMQSILEKGITPVSDLPLGVRERLRQRGIEFVIVREIKGGNTTYAYDKRIVENPKHEATVSEVCRFLDHKGILYEPPRRTREPDIVCRINPLKIAIEVELGTNSFERVQEKINRLGESFDQIYVLVDSLDKLRYEKNVEAKKNVSLVNRSDLIKEIEKLEKLKEGKL